MADIDALTRNAVKLLPEGELQRKLALGRPLRVKLGIDPTARDIHIGNAIPLQRMRAFQRQGHVGVLIIGDYTARIGDPSGRSKERKLLSDEQIDANARAYFEQASRIVDPERTELRFNSEWLGGLDFAEILRLTRTTTVSRLLERNDFERRFRSNQPISVSELLYPLMQGYDSVADQRRRRAGRHRPGVQPADCPRHPAGLRRGAAGDSDHAADPGPERDREDERFARQLHRHLRPAGRDVRQGDERRRRADARLLPADAGGR